MDSKILDQIVDRQVLRCKRLLSSKETEYSPSCADRLQQFHDGSAATGRTAQEVLGGFLLKHTLKLHYALSNRTTLSTKQFDELLTDIHNYLFLLKALGEVDE